VKDFAAKIPEEIFSPAEIFLFLLEYKHSPTNIVAQVEEWVNRTKDKQSELKQDSWLHSA